MSDTDKQQSSDSKAVSANSTETKTDPSEKTAAKSSPAAKSPPAVKNKVSKLAVLSLLVAGTALGGSAYLWQQMQQPRDKLAADMSTLQQQIAQQQNSVSDIKSALEKQNTANRQKQLQLQDAINDLSLALQTQVKNTNAISSFQRTDWSLAEAEYLVKLANQSVLMAKEVQGAIQLLEAADKILQGFDDAALHSVRKTLIADITALKSVGRHDVEGIYLRLEAISQQIEQLELFKAPQLKIISPTEQQPLAEEDWQQRLQNSYEQAKQKLGQYIQIKRRDEAYKPMLAPEKEAAIRQSMRLMIEQAQLALLSSNQQLYDISLQKSQQWVNDYFAIDEQKVEQFNQLIEELKQAKVSVELPDISASARVLKRYIETLHDLPQQKRSEPQVEDNATAKPQEDDQA